MDIRERLEALRSGNILRIESWDAIRYYKIVKGFVQCFQNRECTIIEADPDGNSHPKIDGVFYDLDRRASVIILTPKSPLLTTLESVICDKSKAAEVEKALKNTFVIQEKK